MAAPIQKYTLFGTAVVVSKENCQYFRQILEKHEVWDRSRKLRTVGDKICIPVIGKAETEIVLLENCLERTDDGIFIDFTIEDMDLPASRKSLMRTPVELMGDRVKCLAEENGMELSDSLLGTIPRHWEIHGDLLLLPADGFSPHSQWDRLGEKLWKVVASCVGCRRVARKQPIVDDVFRSPRVQLLLGQDGCVQHLDNAIKYRYDVTKCMFSVGNITEKLRIAQFDCMGETVVDLYAGIGYFTLPYLVHAKADRVHACEWNPDAVIALEENLRLNSVQDRCVVHQGDNRQVCLRGVADRVNLGLIPSSEPGWPVACAALRADKGGVLHIHGNVITYNKDLVGLRDLSNHQTEHLNTEVMLTNGGDEAAKPAPKSTDDKTSPVCTVNKDSMVPHNTSECTGHVKTVLPQDWQYWARQTETFTNDNTGCARHQSWESWARQTETVISGLLMACHEGLWRTTVLHIQHVKSYAPHVDHVVLDLDCRPVTRTQCL